MFKGYLKWFLVIILANALLLLSGCALWPLKKRAPIKRDVIVRVYVASKVNLNILHRSSPIAITVYQLKDVKAFNMATYKELVIKPPAWLKKQIISQNTEVIWPGYIGTFVLPGTTTKGIGIVANYRLRANKIWKLAFNGKSSSYRVSVTSSGIFFKTKKTKTVKESSWL